MQSQLDRISLVKQTLNRPKHSHILPTIAERLRKLIERCQLENKYDDVWVLATPYFASAPDDVVIRWLGEILKCYRLPHWLRGQFNLELAKRLIADHETPECHDLLAQADAAFKNSTHAFGASEIRRLRLQHGLDTTGNVLQELVSITASYVEAEYAFGVLNSAISPLTLAFNQGNYRLYVNLQECFHTVCNEAGIHHERLLLEIQLLAALNASTGHYATVLSLGRAVYKECVALRYWTMAFLAGRVLSLALHMREENAEALKYAEEIYKICDTEDLYACSEAAYHLAMVRGSRLHHGSIERDVDCCNIVEFLLPTVDGDIQDGDIRMACDKLCFIAGLQFEMARRDPEGYQGRKSEAELTINRTKYLASGLDGREKATVEGACDEMLITQLLHEGKKCVDDEKEMESIGLSTRLIVTYERQGLKFHAAMKYQFRALCRQQIFQKKKDLKERLQHLSAAESDYAIAGNLFEAIGSWQQVLVSRHAQARIHVEAWDLCRIPVDFVLNSLGQLETVADLLRRELSALEGLPALLQKQKFSAMTQIQDLYRWATAVEIISGRHQDLLVWSQKRKARSLSEMLGLGLIVPAAVRQAMSKEPCARDLFDELQGLNIKLHNASQSEKPYTRQRIQDLEIQIRQYSAFDDFVTLRDGIVSQIAELSMLKTADGTTGQQRGVIFADWVAREDLLYLMTVNTAFPEDSCQLQQLPLSLSIVRQWLNDHFSTDKARKDCLQQDNLKDDAKPLRMLDCLVSPLQSISNRDDLILLSPTSNLSALPLHALKIVDSMSGKAVPLIERNPVVYVPSLPIAKLCVVRGEQQNRNGRSLFFGMFDKKTEAQLIHEQMSQLATEMDGMCFIGDVATKERYAQEVTSARLIHHHLHCIFSANNVLNQSLVLSQHPHNDPVSSGATAISTPSSKDDGIGDCPTGPLSALMQANDEIEDTPLLSQSDDCAGTHLSVEEIFKLALDSPLVVLVACESASQTISEGDEPLGLITGFLCAGAASVIGASWPIPSGTGREFSRKFYDQIRNTPKSGIVDLAVALQEAVLSIRDCPLSSSTYHWGAFSLYGSWLFRPPWDYSITD
jgi:CHAT domain-containing protein